MKRTTTSALWGTIFVCVGLLVLPTPARAVDFSLYGGLWGPDDTDDSLGVGARVAFFETLQLEIDASYYRNFEPRFRFERRDGTFDVFTNDLEIVPIEAALRYNFGDSRIGFYLGGGVGWYMLDSDVRGELDDEVGIFVKIGWQYEHFFLEGLYRDVDSTVETLELGNQRFREAPLDLSGPAIHLGWRF